MTDETQSRLSPRDEPITDEERLFDLIPAAWGMDDGTFEALARFPEGWMWKWRNHYLAPTSDQLQRIRRLARFHDSIRLTHQQSSTYSEWWRRTWRSDSFIGAQSPLQAALADGDEFLDLAELHFTAVG